MKTIALLFDRPMQPFHIAPLIERLRQKGYTIQILLHQKSVAPASAHTRFFALLQKLEGFMTRLMDKSLASYLHQTDLRKIDLAITELQATLQNGKIRYDKESLQKIEALQPNLLLLAETGPQPDLEQIGDIPSEGVLQIRYSDVETLQSDVIAFWEIYRRMDKIGFSVEKYENGYTHTLFSGKVATFRQFVPMQIRLLREALPYLVKTIDRYLQGEMPLSETAPERIIATRRLPLPSLKTQLAYLGKTALLYGNLVLQKALLKKESRFHVAFMFQEWQGAELSRGIEIKTPAKHFYADPFVWQREGRTVCFVEDYDYTQHIAWISAVELFEEGRYQILGPVIREPFHMSYPYLFEYENELYMIPETTQDRSVRLYKCIEFPMRWEFQKTLMEGVKTADTMVFAHQGKWWMLTNLSTPDNDDQAAQLFAFFADSPLSDTWQPHPKNPLVFDSDCGRNGGLLFTHEGVPVRGRQKQAFNIYGAELSIAKITRLDTNDYEERLLSWIKPDFFDNLKATHHIHSHNGVTVWDYMRLERAN